VVGRCAVLVVGRWMLSVACLVRKLGGVIASELEGSWQAGGQQEGLQYSGGLA
jgi:hypothetical protein